MSISAHDPSSVSDRVADALAAALFCGFVALLFLGYPDPDFPYADFASLPLLSSFIVLFWANRRSDRVPSSAPGL